jgi:hypothetical protein
VRIDLLVKDLERHPFVGELVGNLAAMDRRASQPVQLCDDQRIVFPGQFETDLQGRAGGVRPTGFFLKKFFILGRAPPLQREILVLTRHPCLPDLPRGPHHRRGWRTRQKGHKKGHRIPNGRQSIP